MKGITESIQLNEGILRGRLSSNDKRNFLLIAQALESITSEISDWMMDDEENEDSDTASLAHNLSNLASQLRGEWPEEITFDYR